jgi:hypothetical protein
MQSPQVKNIRRNHFTLARTDDPEEKAKEK